ncbi:cytochrome P450 [Daedaleopsis nitida]|nr:cytochrome P450 [Daedaleopsis nitida]
MGIAPSTVLLSVSLAFLGWRYLLRDFVVRSPLDNLPGPRSGSIFTGNVMQLLAHDSWGFLRELIDTYGPISKLHGFFGGRWLNVYDPKALHTILVKEQEDVYVRDAVGIDAVRLLIGPGLLGATGVEHKRQRKMLNPVFSAAHIRNMTPMFYEVTAKLRNAIESRVRDGAKPIDVIGWMGRTALELVGQGGFGHSFDSLIEESKDAYTDAVKSFIPSLVDLEYMRIFLPLAPYMGPAWLRRRILDMLPNKKIQRVKDISDIMYSRSKEIFHAKKAAIERGDESVLNEIGERRDLMSILLKSNMVASEEDKLPDEELLAQMSTFILAGVDTTSNALGRVFHMLAQHPEVQERLRSEILAARAQFGEEIPYDELSRMPYLDAVCRETLRLFSPAALTTRCAARDTVLPLSEPIRGRDGTVLHEVVVPKGTMVVANFLACNTNKALWGADALEWKPDRWLNPLPHAVEEAHVPGIYANLMTFSGGGRACIGFKFSQFEMKVVLAVLVGAFRFELSDKPFVWNFAGVAYPAANIGDKKPEMFLRVSLASPA